jgi:hypothetical protein
MSGVEFTEAFQRYAAGLAPRQRFGDSWLEPAPPSEVDWFHNPRYIVLRAAPGKALPERYEGRWEEVADIPRIPRPLPPGVAEATGRATGRYERREDGRLGRGLRG